MPENLGALLHEAALAMGKKEMAVCAGPLASFATQGESVFDPSSHGCTREDAEVVVRALVGLLGADEAPDWCDAEFVTSGFGCLKERLGTGAFHTRDGFNVAFRHGLQFDTGPRNHAVVSAALKALLNSVFRNPPMLALFHEMEGETRLAAAISSKGFGESPLSLQRQVLQLTYVILAMHEPSLGVFRRGGGIHTLADGLSQHLQPFAHDGERDEEIPDDVAAVLAEYLKILFLLTNNHWSESPAFADPTQLTILPSKDILEEFRTVVPCVRQLLRTSTATHTKLCLHAVELLVNTPPCASCLLLRNDANTMEKVALGAETRPQPKPAVITERHWDPDRPGEETVRVIQGGEADTEGAARGDERPSEPRRAAGGEADPGDAQSMTEYSQEELSVCSHLLDLLARQLDVKENLHETAMPLFGVLRMLVLDNRAVRKAFKRQVLPPRKDLSVGPEVGDSLRAKLVRLMTSANSQLKTMAADFLFVICNRNAGRLVKHVGYGHAAGFLTDMGIMGMPHAVQDTDSSGTEEETGGGAAQVDESAPPVDINPVTAREWDDDPAPKFVSEEHREHAAHELLGLIDRLNKTGVMKVNLPPPKTPPSSGDEL